ncbi:MAG: T9SS type A sorting domain-containing protein [Bacteroidota bacterium]
MKKSIFFFTLFIIALSVRSQEWAPVGASWHYTEEFFMPVNIDQDYIKFESVGDTLYHGKLCRKITKRHNIACTDRPGVEYMYSENEKVWFWDPNFSTFQVLYDFSAVQGGSWVILVDDYVHADVDSLIVRVDSANMVVINGVQLKRLFVTYDFRNETSIPYTYPGVLIQRVGDLYFMLNYTPEYLFACDGNMSGGLRCYQDQVVGLYETGIADSCTYVHQMTGIKPVAGNHSGITFFPNPADETITIETSLPGAIEYGIADLSGRIVKAGLVKSSKIATGNLQPGIYHLYFSRDGVRLPESQKLVIR